MSDSDKRDYDTLTENTIKKAYLREYRTHVQRINRIEEELEEVRDMKTSISVSGDGMPHGSSQNDLSEYASILDALERELIEERYMRINAYKGILERVKRLRSAKENDVIFYRYIKGMDWWEIAEKLGLSERWVFKLHGRGLANLEIPDSSL